MGLILDQFVNLETQCIIAVISSIRGVSDVNNQDKLIYYVVKTIAYITLGFIVINLLVLSVWRIKLNIYCEQLDGSGVRTPIGYFQWVI